MIATDEHIRRLADWLQCVADLREAARIHAICKTREDEALARLRALAPSEVTK